MYIECTLDFLIVSESRPRTGWGGPPRGVQVYIEMTLSIYFGNRGPQHLFIIVSSMYIGNHRCTLNQTHSITSDPFVDICCVKVSVT